MWTIQSCLWFVVAPNTKIPATQYCGLSDRKTPSMYNFLLIFFFCLFLFIFYKTYLKDQERVADETPLQHWIFIIKTLLSRFFVSHVDCTALMWPLGGDILSRAFLFKASWPTWGHAFHHFGMNVFHFFRAREGYIFL